MRCAYVTLCMRGDGYVPGALVLAYALKLHSNIDLVCLVTHDVSEASRRLLGELFDAVVDIPEIRIRSSLQDGRRDRDLLLTRFGALRLGGDGDLGAHYDKIILLDADVLPLGGYDDLFALPAPAGILMEGKSAWLAAARDGAVSREVDGGGRWRWHRTYESVCAHGEPIPSYLTDRVRADPDNMGVNAGLWRLDPAMDEYRGVLRFLREPEILRLVTERFPWPEMQLATLLWSGRWTNIDIRCCSIGGYPRLDALRGTHFAGLKPWQIRRRSIRHYARFPDFDLWYQYFTAMWWSHPALRGSPTLRRIWEFAVKSAKR